MSCNSVSQDHETLTSAKKKLDKIKLHSGKGKEVNFYTWDNNAQISIEGTGHRFSILFDASGVSLKDETTGKFLFQRH